LLSMDNIIPCGVISVKFDSTVTYIGIFRGQAYFGDTRIQGPVMYSHVYLISFLCTVHSVPI